jgi:hypothetical protein
MTDAVFGADASSRPRFTIADLVKAVRDVRRVPHEPAQLDDVLTLIEFAGRALEERLEEVTRQGTELERRMRDLEAREADVKVRMRALGVVERIRLSEPLPASLPSPRPPGLLQRMIRAYGMAHDGGA